MGTLHRGMGLVRPSLIGLFLYNAQVNNEKKEIKDALLIIKTKLQCLLSYKT